MTRRKTPNNILQGTEDQLLAAEDAVVAVPVVVEPVPVLDPAVSVPVDVVHVVGVAGMPPKICNLSSKPPPLEYSRGCILFGDFISLTSCTKYFHLKKYYDSTLNKAVTLFTSRLSQYPDFNRPKPCLPAGRYNRGQKHLLSEIYYNIKKEPPHIFCSKALDMRGCYGRPLED